MATTTLSHPTVGSIKGTTAKPGVEQFLGLQYATLADRFAAPVLKEYTADESVDATKLGPQVVNIPDGPQMEQSLIQHTLPDDTSHLTASDTEGLNLNITVPAGTSEDAKLPVFVFIHGGGFMVGSATWPQYDFAKLVSLSKAKGRPVIAVSLNYRLGVAGLLTSKELRDAGYKPNNAIRDQRTALLWVQKHIAGFGGDAENVTLAGESAGSISCTYHLQSAEPLFKRVLLLSGTSLLLPPLPVEVAEQSYQSAIKTLGLTSATTQERIHALLTIDAGELSGKLRATPMLPTVDDELPLASHTFADFTTSGNISLPGVKWCESVMIGDCQFDGNIQGLRLMHRKQGIASAFCQHMQKSFSTAETTDRLLQAYSITPELDDDTAFFRVLEVANDVGFYAPTVSYAQLLSGDVKTYMYRFNEPNPWDGPWKGHSTHILDIAFLFQNFNEYFEPAQRGLAEGFAEDVFKFVYGEEPWQAWESDKKVAKVLGPGGKVGMADDEPENVGRRKALFELAEEIAGGMDHLAEAFNSFLRGPPAT
ncbi:hypothetical protein LTR36_002585 [Oleoguttula mirabilis]|uniref:Carboxylic ester hydrolase n=1 Tax=Oleoguttula mirabilis TaxID=1507867 RepID=A0AAV9JK03_9PEZI|nr:hypothetical protein LTR36_002585 [Oleoguttula mirabilis]